MIAIGSDLNLGGPGGWIAFEPPKMNTQTERPAEATTTIGSATQLHSAKTWRVSAAAAASAMLGVAIGAMGLAMLTPAAEPRIYREHEDVWRADINRHDQAGDSASASLRVPPHIASTSRELEDESMHRTAEVIRAAIKRAQERERAGGQQ